MRLLDLKKSWSWMLCTTTVVLLGLFSLSCKVVDGNVNPDDDDDDNDNSSDSDSSTGDDDDDNDSDSDSSSSGDDDDDPVLADRIFLSQLVEIDGEPHELVEGTTLRVRFIDDHKFSASAGCNTLGAQYKIEDYTLVLSDTSATEMGCDEPYHEQDEWYFAFLSSSPDFKLSADELILDNGKIRVEYLDEEIVNPDKGLISTKWIVDTIYDSGTASNADWNPKATLVLEKSGTANLYTGCNDGGAEFVVEGATITFNELCYTEVACPDDIQQELERAVISLFERDTPLDWEIDADKLEIMDGDVGLRFVAQD